MAFQTLLQYFLVPLFWLCCLVVLVQAARSPRNVALRYFSIVVVLLVVANSLASIDRETTSLARLLFNLCGIAAVYFEVCFFRTALQQPGGRTAAYWWETVVAVVVMVVGTAAWLAAPEELRPDLGQPKNSANVAALAFQISILGYGFVNSARIVVWCVRLFGRLRGQPRTGRRIAGFGFEAGLVLIVVAETALLLAVAGKLVSGVLVFTGPERIPAVQAFYAPLAFLASLGNGVLVLGIIVPVVCGAVATVSVALRHRRDHRTLEPLWSAVRAAFPQLPMRTRRGVNGQFYRRGLEVKDSFLLLAPYYDASVAAATEARCRAAGSSPEETSAHVGAALMVDALENLRAGRPVADPHPAPVSGADDWSSDMAWVLRVARIFNATSTAGARR